MQRRCADRRALRSWVGGAGTRTLLLLALLFPLVVPGPARCETDAAAPPPPSIVLETAAKMPIERLTQRTPEQVSQLYLKLQAKFMSPYCPGRVLRDCTSSGGAALREQIRTWLQEGHTETWITQTLEAAYGENVLAAPPFHGEAIVVWVAPIIALLVGGVLLLQFLKRQRRGAAAAAAGMAAGGGLAVDGATGTGAAASTAGASGQSGGIGGGRPIDPELDRRLEAEVQARMR